MDSFYKTLTKQQVENAKNSMHDFDHPDSFDYELMLDVLSKLKLGIKVDVPIYDFITHSRLKKTKTVYGATVIIFEGLFVLHDSKIRKLFDLKLFVDCDADIRLSRRLIRDINERGRDVQGVIDQYERFVKPSFDEYIFPTIKHADSTFIIFYVSNYTAWN
jgi:uridine kinase